MKIHAATSCYLFLALLPLAGCYNSQSLLKEARNQAIRTRLDEVNIGYFRTTLPRSAVDDSPMEVEVDLFGTGIRYKLPEIEETLESSEYRLRQAVLVALRQTTAAEVADPNLTTFRERLLLVVNEELGETPVESIGFRSVRFIPL